MPGGTSGGEQPYEHACGTCSRHTTPAARRRSLFSAYFGRVEGFSPGAPPCVPGPGALCCAARETVRLCAKAAGRQDVPLASILRVAGNFNRAPCASVPRPAGRPPAHSRGREERLRMKSGGWHGTCAKAPVGVQGLPRKTAKENLQAGLTHPVRTKARSKTASPAQASKEEP